MKKLIEIPMKHFIKKRVTVFKNGKTKFYYINKLLKELFTPEELHSEELNVVPTKSSSTNEDSLEVNLVPTKENSSSGTV
jgi:hypothetical protein